MTSFANRYARIGIFMSVTLTICFFSYFYILKNGVLGNETKLFIFSENAYGLTTTSPVMYKGLKIGTINDLSITNNQILVEMSIDKNVQLPKSIELKSSMVGYFGDHQIEVENATDSAEFYQSGDTISSLLGFQVQNALIDSNLIKDIEPSLKEISNTIGNALIDYSNSIDTTKNQ